MTTADNDKAIFGEAIAEKIPNLRAANPSPEDLTEMFFRMWGGPEGPTESPAHDLFKRRRYSDLLSVTIPGIDDRYRYNFVMACLKHEVAETSNEAILYDLIDHAMQDDVVNEIVDMTEKRHFSELVDKLCPKADKKTREELSRHLRDTSLDTDKLAEELDKDVARGVVSAGEAVNQIIHGLYLSPQEFFATAAVDALQRLLPSIPQDFMADCMRALRLKLTEGEREVVHTVTETRFVSPPPPADEVIEAAIWDHAKTYVEKIAMLAKPLAGAGLDSTMVMQTVWQALAIARNRNRPVPETFQTFPEFSGPDPRVSQHFGTTILDKSFFFHPPDGDE